MADDLSRTASIGKRAQMDLIDMTSQPDPDGYCLIIVLYDLSGFGAAKALQSKTSKEVSIASSSVCALLLVDSIMEER
eukprot:scaffold13717_cov154-Skeletonema_marinoi.AAC.2